MVDMAVTYNETMDQIDRNTALLNILRAGDDMPMSFSSLSYVNGSGSLSGNLGISDSLSLAPNDYRSRSYNANLGLSASRNFSFTLNSLDNEQFMRGFLADLPLEKLHYLANSQYSNKALLWTLVTNSTTLDDSSKGREVITNAPNADSWSRFQDLVFKYTGLGVTLEYRTQEVPVGPPLSRDEALNQLGTVFSGWNSGNYGSPEGVRPKMVMLTDGDPARNHQMVMESKKVQFCFDPPDLQQWPYDADFLCRTGGTYMRFEQWVAGNKHAGLGQRSGPSRTLWRDINLRSPREVYQFVGKVAQTQLRNPGHDPFMVGPPGNPQRQLPLIVVKCDEVPMGTRPLAVAAYHGKMCYIPASDAGHSAEVLQSLSLLVTLSKVPGAIATSPALLIK